MAARADHTTLRPRMQAARPPLSDALAPSDTFRHRHIGPSDAEIAEMLARIGCASLDELIDQTVPRAIRLEKPLSLAGLSERELGEREVLERLRALASRNRVLRSCIGMGYSDTIVPPVIQRNVLENPGWYTQYTPYQAEISQGRLEALLAFQTLVADLTGLPLANASLLDEATAAAEAMAMCHAAARGEEAGLRGGRRLPPADARRGADARRVDGHRAARRARRLARRRGGGRLRRAAPVPDQRRPHRRSAPRDRARPRGRRARGGRGRPARAGAARRRPASSARTSRSARRSASACRSATAVRTPPTSPRARSSRGGCPADSSACRATRTAVPAYRLAIQTREQHIRRDKATSNICTAQVLLAIMAGLYAVYHGPDGLRRIARRVRGLTCALAEGLRRMGHELADGPFFDTLRVVPSGQIAPSRCWPTRCERGINLRPFGDESVGVSLDETTTREDVERAARRLRGGRRAAGLRGARRGRRRRRCPPSFERRSPILEHPVFHAHHSEHEMLRYLHRLAGQGSLAHHLDDPARLLHDEAQRHERDAAGHLAGVRAACTPSRRRTRRAATRRCFAELESWLAEITGLPAVSLQPNAGSQGEYAGPAGDPPLPRRARRGRTATSA